MDNIAMSLLESSEEESELSIDFAGIDEIFLSSSFGQEDDDCERHAKVANFMDTIDDYSEVDFKSHFRVERFSANYMTDMYSSSNIVPGSTHGGKAVMGPKKEIHIYLWYVANTVTYRQLGNLFGVAKSSSWQAVNRVTYWLISIGHEYVNWPRGSEALQQQEKFRSKKGIPGIIGAIDCTHITIKEPKEHKTDYFDRKRNYSIILQAVVDADKKFTDLFVGDPGSLHDSRIIRRSNLYSTANENLDELFPNDTFILGDSAYQSSNWIVPPFKNYGVLTHAQRQFNYIHSATRMIVENAFGMLKTRFRRLLFFSEQSDIKSIVNIVLGACILHNMCILWNDEIEVAIELEDDEIDNVPADVSAGRRERLLAYLISNGIITE